MSYGIPPVSSMFDIVKELAVESSEKRIPGIIKKIRKATHRGGTSVTIWKLLEPERDHLLGIFRSQGYSVCCVANGWLAWTRVYGLTIDWSEK